MQHFSLEKLDIGIYSGQLLLYFDGYFAFLPGKRSEYVKHYIKCIMVLLPLIWFLVAVQLLST